MREVIRLRDVGLYYPLRAVGIKDRIKNSLGLQPVKKHWALRDLNFSVNEGECISVLGINGAGKSTMMRILAEIITPDEGEVLVNGTARLLSAKAGLNPNLSGRTNIHLSAAYIGISGTNVKNLEQDVVEFSELGEYIDQPVRSYSAGMKSRLAFSIATAVEADILLVDEGLAAGDEYFRTKAEKRILSVLEDARTVIIVTHQLSVARDVTNRSIVIHDGHVVFDNTPREAIKEYKKIIHKRSFLKF